MSDPNRQPNRLIHEPSPYLQQHAYNPVDWYPWGAEALQKARTENKPIFLSIGYSACHWCHVMERESFENPETAAYLNEHYVSIKVDREERPDLDHVYQLVCQLLTRSGGWPLTVFLTPEQRPFYAGTYYPPEDRYGRPGFPRLLAGILDAYRSRRGDLEQTADKIIAALSQVEAIPKAEQAQAPERALLAAGAEYLAQQFDRENGGFGSQPKFPNPTNLELFFRHWRASGDQQYLDLALLALRKMAQGGVYDQIGGGFHRYSVDAHWAVPHFEKMLYDNALLVPLYLTGYQVSEDPFYARIVRETLGYVEREMTYPEGGFFSTLDADSEGEEGKFYVWRPQQVMEAAPEDFLLLTRHLGVTEDGNFEENTTVLHVAESAAALARALDLPEAEIQARLEAGKEQMLKHREKRMRPFRDDKILTGWNGLMISAFARAAQVLGDEHYAGVAAKAAAFIEGRLRAADGGLLRRWKDGLDRQRTQASAGKETVAAIPAYLEDYAYYAQGLIDLYEATFDRHYLRRAVDLARTMLHDFADPAGGFFLTGAGAEKLVHRPKEAQDSATPAAQSIAVPVPLRLYPFTGDEAFRRAAEQVLQAYQPLMAEHPWGSASLIAALDIQLGAVEISIAAPPGDRTARQWLAAIHRRYLPGRILTLVPADPAAPDLAPDGKVPLWEGRTAREGRATAYVCKDFACSPPCHTWEEIAVHLPS